MMEVFRTSIGLSLVSLAITHSSSCQYFTFTKHLAIIKLRQSITTVSDPPVVVLRIVIPPDMGNAFDTDWEDLDPTESDKMFLQWLSPLSPSEKYVTALSKRQAKTGEWFLNSDSFRDWKGSKKRFLWLHGGAGFGKTTLR